jgi:competence protein ComEA
MLDQIDRGRLVGYAAALLLVVAIVLRLHSHGSPPPAAVSLSAPARAAPASASAAPATSARLYVDVAGAVRRPGLYQLPAGARVAVAVERAGGLARRAERTGVNLAAPLHDGEQVIVPARGSAAVAAAAGASGGAGGSAAGGGGGSGPAAPISLSQASEAQLEQIDGIGPKLAGRIIEYRNAHGGFRSVGELRQVSGIGDKRFATLSRALRP